MRSELNSFDSNIQSFTGTSFTGTYEPVKENNYIIFNIYTAVADTLTIYYTDNPNNTLITDTYSIPIGSTILTLEIKSRFIKIQISTTGDTSEKRIYDLNLVDASTNFSSSIKNSFTFWDNELIDGTEDASYFSEICDVSNKKIDNISIYGTSTVSGTLILQYSNDGTNFYNTQYSYNVV